MMKTTFKIVNQVASEGHKIAIIKALRALGGLCLRDAKIGSEDLIAGDTFAFDSSNDPSQLAELVTLGVEIVGQETDTYVAAARDLAIRAISCGQYSKARSILMALVDIDPVAR